TSFSRDLLLRALVIWLEAAARAFFGELAQVADFGSAIGHGIVGKLVAEIGEREPEALRNRACVGDRLRNIGEEARHLRGRLHVAFAVARQQTACLGERGVIANAGEDVEQLALRGRGAGGMIGRDNADAETARAVDGRLIVRFLLAIEVTLNL